MTASSPPFFARLAVGAHIPRMSVRRCAWLLALAITACQSKSNKEPLVLLDPDGVHFGKTYGEWAAEWMSWAYDFAPPLCQNPIRDKTGAWCANAQDPERGVFFLAGTYGGPVKRTECVVPAGAALFFPIIIFGGDNAGLDEPVTDAEIKQNVDHLLAGVNKDSLYVTVDGRPVRELERGISKEAVPYRLHLPAGPNAYTCNGSEGVHGDFNGYIAGAWVMLAPLPSGKHVVTFGAKHKDPSLGADFMLDVRYELRVATPGERSPSFAPLQ